MLLSYSPSQVLPVHCRGNQAEARHGEWRRRGKNHRPTPASWRRLEAMGRSRERQRMLTERRQAGTRSRAAMTQSQQTGCVAPQTAC